MNEMETNTCKAIIKFPDVKPEVLEFLERQNNVEQTESNFKAERIRKTKSRLKVSNIAYEMKLRQATTTNNYEMVNFYLKKGTNPNASDHYKRTPLHLASCRGYTEIVNLLLEYGADPNLLDTLGNNPLHLAACSSNLGIIESLLRAGINIDSVNRNGQSSLDLARSKLKILLNKTSAVSGNPQEASAIIQDFQKIVNIMIHFKNIIDVDELSSLSSRIQKMSTNDVQCEISHLLNQIDGLKLEN